MLLELHHPVWEAVRSGSVGIASGGVAFRYIRIAAKTMPSPVDGASWTYRWVYNFLQNAFDNQELRRNGNSNDK